MRTRAAGAFVVVTLGALVLGAGCPRPPVTPPGEGEGEGDRVVVDLPTFVQDRPAIGGKWYDYNVDGHILEPKDEAWVVVDPDDNAHGFRIAGVYDGDSGDSGVFHLDVVHRAGDGWSAPATWVSPRNVKDGPVCLDLSSVTDVDCDGPHDLRFALQSRLSVLAGFAVAEPAVFLGDGVVAARSDGVGLDDLPDPAGLDVLDDGDAGFDDTDWDFAQLAPDLPGRGQALGDLARVVANDWVLVDGGRGLVEFSVTAERDAPVLTFSVRRRAIDSDDFSVARDEGELVDVDVDAKRLPVFVSFREADLLTPADNLAGVSWPTRPPKSRDYDVVLVDDDGALRVLLSPAAAVKRSAP